MIRNLYISSLMTLAIALVTATTGCNKDISAGADLEHATQVTFDELKEVTQGQRYFFWIGSDKDFHYFETHEGFYRLTTKFEIPLFANRIERKNPLDMVKTPAVIVGDKISYWSSRMERMETEQ